MVPARIVPARGKVSENVEKPPSSQSWDVFHEDVAGHQLANESLELRPKTGSVTCKSCSFASGRNVLAGEAPGEHVDLVEVVRTAVAHVGEAGHVGPMQREDLAAEVVNLDLPGAAHARPVEPEVDATDAREEAAVAQRRGVG